MAITMDNPGERFLVETPPCFPISGQIGGEECPQTFIYRGHYPGHITIRPTEPAGLAGKPYPPIAVATSSAKGQDKPCTNNGTSPHLRDFPIPSSHSQGAAHCLAPFSAPFPRSHPPRPEDHKLSAIVHHRGPKAFSDCSPNCPEPPPGRYPTSRHGRPI